MPYVIKIDGEYVARRGYASKKLDRARVYLRKCDASNSLSHGQARWYKTPTSTVEVIEVAIRIKTKRVPVIKTPSPFSF